MLKDRQKSILEAVIREYTKTALPVASKDLVDRYRLDVSPATIRNEMFELDRLGYLEQPHTSSGRIPTDEGYRLLLNEVFKERQVPLREQELLDELFEEDLEEFVHLSARLISQLSRSFTISGRQGEGQFYKTGFSEVLAEPEFRDDDFIREFGELVDLVDERIKAEFSNYSFTEPRVFVGDENPIREARRCGMIISSISHPGREESMIVILGPRRMNYQKNISLVNYLSHHARRK
jgi:transcriptional regulator of heat shock response